MISGSMCEGEIHCSRLTQMSLYLTCATHTILNIHILLSRISANSMGAAQWTLGTAGKLLYCGRALRGI